MIISSAYRLSRSFDFLKMKSVTSHIEILAPRRTSSITHSTHWGSVAFFSRKAANIRPAPHSAFDMGPAGPTRPSLLLAEYERSMYMLLARPKICTSRLSSRDGNGKPRFARTTHCPTPLYLAPPPLAHRWQASGRLALPGFVASHRWNDFMRLADKARMRRRIRSGVWRDSERAVLLLCQVHLLSGPWPRGRASDETSTSMTTKRVDMHSRFTCVHVTKSPCNISQDANRSGTSKSRRSMRRPRVPDVGSLARSSPLRCLHVTPRPW